MIKNPGFSKVVLRTGIHYKTEIITHQNPSEPLLILPKSLYGQMQLK
jgi:hypothetical protein